MPHHVNNHGHVFGGVILSMVDRAAGVAAMRHSGRPCVTVSIDRVDFKEPIFTGELVTCRARVNFVGRTSMEIGVRVEAEKLLSREKHHTNTCFLTFVAIDSEHRPVPVPPLELETEEDRKAVSGGAQAAGGPHRPGARAGRGLTPGPGISEMRPPTQRFTSKWSGVSVMRLICAVKGTPVRPHHPFPCQDIHT